MQAYSVDLTDASGRPIIKKPIDLDELLRRDNRSMDIAPGVRVTLEEVPGAQEAHRAARQHGFDDGVHAPFGFGEVQEWYDVVQAVQEGGKHHRPQQLDASVVEGTQRPTNDGASSFHRQASPQRGAVRFDEGPRATQQPTQGPPANKKEQWAAYAPPLAVTASKDFKRMKALDITPSSAGGRPKFSPLALAMHSCVMAPRGANRAAHFLVFGGTNGKSDESEMYEFSLVSSSWRRVEVKGSAPHGVHSHVCARLDAQQHTDSSASSPGGQLVVVGGVSYDAPSVVHEELFQDKPASQARCKLLCPRVASINGGRAALYRSSFIDAARNTSAAATAAANSRGYSLDSLVPRLAAAQGVSLSTLQSSPKKRTQRRRFQSNVCVVDEATLRCKNVTTPVTLNIAGHTLSVFGGMMYLFGGVNELMEVSDKLVLCHPQTFVMRIFRVRDDAVSPCARYYHTAVSYGQWILVYGGFDANNEPLSDLWAFDCVQESWERLNTVGQLPPRAGHAACVIGCRMVIVGGFDAALDSEGAKPLGTIIEINLVPAAKGFMVRTLPVTPALPPVAFATATSCDDFATLFLFGGMTVGGKRKQVSGEGSKKKRTANGSDDDAYSSDEDHESPSNTSAPLTAVGGSDGDVWPLAKFPLTNKSFLVTFPEQEAASKKKRDDGPKLNHLGLVIDENELPAHFKAFVRKQEDFLKKRDDARSKAIKKLHLEESEGAEVNLYLTPAEIESLLAKCDDVCGAISAYDVKAMPGHVPDKETREHMVDECVGLMRQARDVMKSMKGHEGPKQVKSKGHRKKTGEKFEDHSAAKPFRRVIIMDLVSQTHHYLVSISKLNKSLKTVEWPQKPEYLQYVRTMRSELQSLVDLIKNTMEKYISHRVESLIKAEEKHKNNLLKLKEIVAKIQHDKVFKKDAPDARREARKKVLLQDDRRNKEASESTAQTARRRRARKKKSRSVSPVLQPGQQFKEVLIEIPKDEAKQLMKRCDWVQKAATEFAWYCNHTMSVMQPVVTAPAASTSAAPSFEPPKNAHQEAITRDADAARSSAIDLSNTIAASSYAFRTLLEADVNATTAQAPAATPSAVQAAKVTTQEAKVADAKVCDPTAPPVVPTLPPQAERAKDPQHNILLRLSSARALTECHATLKSLLHTIGRIRVNKWDPNDTGGPKQDEQAEKLCRALFHRQTNLLSRVNAAFLMHKGARSPRKKVVREDPLMITSAAAQKRNRELEEQKLKAKAPAQSLPPHAVATVVSLAPSVPAPHTAPVVALHRHVEPLVVQSFACEVPSSWQPSVTTAAVLPWRSEGIVAPQPPPAPSAFGVAVPSSSVQASAAVLLSTPMSFAASAPASCAHPFPLSASGPVVPYAVGGQVGETPQTPAANLPTVAPSPPPPAAAFGAAPAGPMGQAAQPTSASLPLQPQSHGQQVTYHGVVQPSPSPVPVKTLLPLPPATDVIASAAAAPQVVPEWLAPKPVPAAVLQPPPPASIARGPFNGGIGSLGTYAPIEDYMVVVHPTPASAGFPVAGSGSTQVLPASRVPQSSANTHHNAPAKSSANVSTVNPGFKGKLTPGERTILQSRERNRHW